jgi:hypothetical protein
MRILCIIFALTLAACAGRDAARGDIGFLKLQREILEGSLARQRRKEAEKVVSAPVEFRSPGGYGRALP